MAASMDLTEFHWLLEMFQTVDVGIMVLDKELNVQVWNGFMENHSGKLPGDVQGLSVFSVFPEIDESWFRAKAEPVFLMKNMAFTIWEQRPYLVRFANYRPITGGADFMYQNTTIIPLKSTTGEVSHLGIVIYDVTASATSKLELEAANKSLSEVALRDPLTGMLNHSVWLEKLSDEFDRCQRGRTSSTLVMFDIDNCKKINDEYGHQIGDECIRCTAKLVRSTLRKTDTGGRYAGEELGVFLVDTTADEAKIFAERIRENVATSFVRKGNTSLRYTISLGVAQYNSEFKSVNDWILAAEKALENSKQNGQNQTSIYSAS